MTSKKPFSHVRMLLIDNYDSFTYNLVQAFAAMGASVMVYRNDAITIEEGLALDPTHLVISPGPGRPEHAGVSLDMIGAFAGKVPILGVCLGHQSIVQHYGGKIVRAERLMHGRQYLMACRTRSRSGAITRCARNKKHCQAI
jgi:anthranilate synthase/aminodeoxychorismate synthase-like glutamine amidotransferase